MDKSPLQYITSPHDAEVVCYSWGPVSVGSCSSDPFSRLLQFINSRVVLYIFSSDVEVVRSLSGSDLKEVRRGFLQKIKDIFLKQESSVQRDMYTMIRSDQLMWGTR